MVKTGPERCGRTVVNDVGETARSRRRVQGALLWGRFQPEERASTST
ncbi:hypothetical protein [Levilactobacillus cerevisiae]|nr:hypothetical protein [Levilactobacillus cerevisiae]